MNNFHYREQPINVKSQKSAKLLQQLQMIDREIQEDSKKLAERKRLQAEFYEDGNKMNLADEIMNELLGGRKQQQKPTSLNAKPIRNELLVQQQNKYSAMNREPDFHNQKIQFRDQRPNNSPQKYNDLPNQRQLQKLRLQNRNAREQFPFGGNSRQKDNKRVIGNVARSPERQPAIRDNYIQKPDARMQRPKQNIENPFLKNEQLLRQKRQQQLRNHRRLLQEQMQEQKRKKQQQKQKIKEQVQQKYNNYTPAAVSSPHNDPKFGNQIIGSSAQNKKKRDPNAQHVPIEKLSSQIRSSDLQFMKLKAEQLKTKLKRGRITHQDYEQQARKLENHYKVKIADIFPEDDKPVESIQNNYRAVEQKKINNQNTDRNYSDKHSLHSLQTDRKQTNPSIRNKMGQNNDNINYQNNNTSMPIQFINERVSQPNYSQYPQAPSMQNMMQNPNMNQNFNYQTPNQDVQMQFLMKMLDEYKNMVRMQAQVSLNEKKMLTETINKIIPNVNPIMMTQQVPQYALPQKQYYSEAKRNDKIELQAKPNPQGQAPYSQYSIHNPSLQSDSQISSSYIEKSLSGIVNKIPLTKKQKEEDKNQNINKDIIKFYEKKYKVKKFKGFQYTEDDRNSNIVIPALSNFLQTKNSQNQLNQVFQRDLKNYKKLEKEKNMMIMLEKIKGQKQNPSIVERNPQRVQKKTSNSVKDSNDANNQLNKYTKPQKTDKAKAQRQQYPSSNPFLKKHVSGQQSITQPTANQYAFPQLPLNIPNISSPTPKSAQILQQQQYQTEPRKSDSPPNPNQRLQSKRAQSSTLNSYGQQHQPHSRYDSAGAGKQYPSSKILNIMKTNDEMLSKYELTPSQNGNPKIGSNSLSSIKENVRIQSSKQLSSRQYFSGHDISPVQRRQYESSLQTVRSEQQSARADRKNNRDYYNGSADRSSFNQYRSPTTQYVPHHTSPTVESIDVQRQYEVSASNRRYQAENSPNISGYSQTIQSVDQSSSKLPSFQRPPQNNSRKGGRSVSRKKESLVKVGNSSESFQKSGLSGIPSQGSKERTSKNSEEQQRAQLEASQQKFDSNIYQSAYQQSVQAKQKNSPLKDQSKYERKNIPSTFKEALDDFQKINEKSSLISKPDSDNLNPKQKTETASNPPKWKSLEQARKLAKQFKQRSGQDHNRSSVEQKLSELESFVHTNKKQQVMPAPKIVKQEVKTTNKKKDIMRILDELGSEQYEADFESYRQQSQR